MTLRERLEQIKAATEGHTPGPWSGDWLIIAGPRDSNENGGWIYGEDIMAIEPDVNLIIAAPDLLTLATDAIEQAELWEQSEKQCCEHNRELAEENKRLREALKTILGWREYDCPDNIHRCPCALASVEDTARKALEGDQM